MAVNTSHAATFCRGEPDPVTIDYADFSAIENSLETARVPFEEVVTVYV